MGELLVVAFLGGLITGLSPCIVPVIPVVMAGGSTGTSKWRPYVIIAGLVVSFSVSVLFASSLLGFLHLPQDLLFWLGVALLGLLSVGLLIPKIGEVIERPFARLGRVALRQPGRRLRPGLEPRPRLRAVRRTGPHRHLGGGRAPSRGRDLALRHALLRAGRHRAAPRAGGGRPARHDVVVVAAQPPAHRAQGRRRGAGRGHAGHRLQLARRPAARRPGLHQRAGGPHRVDRFRLHAAAAPQRRAPEPVRRRQRPPRGQEGDLRRDRPGQLAERPPGGRSERRPRRRPPPRPPRRPQKPLGVHGQQDEPAEPGQGPELRRDHGLVQHSRQQATVPEPAAGQGGAGRLLDVLVHQLPACAPPRRGLVQRLQERRLGRGRRVGARIRLRARRLQRRERRGQPRHRLPRCRGRQPGHVGRLQQRVLAGGVPDRPDGHRARLRLRRGRLLQHGGQHPDAPHAPTASPTCRPAPTSPTRHRPTTSRRRATWATSG